MATTTLVISGSSPVRAAACALSVASRSRPPGLYIRRELFVSRPDPEVEVLDETRRQGPRVRPGRARVRPATPARHDPAAPHRRTPTNPAALSTLRCRSSPSAPDCRMPLSAISPASQVRHAGGNIHGRSRRWLTACEILHKALPRKRHAVAAAAIRSGPTPVCDMRVNRLPRPCQESGLRCEGRPRIVSAGRGRQAGRRSRR